MTNRFLKGVYRPAAKPYLPRKNRLNPPHGWMTLSDNVMVRREIKFLPKRNGMTGTHNLTRRNKTKQGKTDGINK